MVELRESVSGVARAGKTSLRNAPALRTRLAAMLLRTRYFARVSPELLEAVLVESSLLRLPGNQVLIHEGSQDTGSMFVLVEGALDVSVKGQQILTFADPGEAIGEVASILRQPRMADVRCQSESTLIEVPIDAVKSHRANHPERYAQFIELIALYLGGKVERTTRRLESYDKQLLETEQLRAHSAQLEDVVAEKLREIMLYSHAFRNSQDAIVLASPQGEVISANPSMCELFGWSDYRGDRVQLNAVLPQLADRQDLLHSQDLSGFKDEWVLEGTTKGDLAVEVTVTPVLQEGNVVAYAYFFRDIRGHKLLLESLEHSQMQLERYSRGLEETVGARTAELRQANADLQGANVRLRDETREKDDALRKLKETQSHLLHSEKMIGLGRLAAGIAHEINNPIGFVRSNLNTLQQYFAGLTGLLDVYARSEVALADTDVGRAIRLELEKIKKSIKLEFLLDDWNGLISDSKEGVERVSAIVKNLKLFTHSDESTWQFADLNEGLESTIQLLWNELKYKTEVEREYGRIPPLECQPGQLNQVFLNVLMNAAQAIEHDGVIRVRTELQGNVAVVAIRDSGCGVSEADLPHIFEPFFTRKPVGSGMGLGLTSAYSIVRAHQGSIEAESKLGEGTTITIRLPIQRHSEMNREGNDG